MKHIQTTCIIINRINFSEADRILTVITPDQGKLSILAKGSRRSKSKLAGGLELFSVSSINLIDGKSELKTVVSTRLIEHFKNIVNDINKTMLSYELLKYIDLNTENECDGQYFEILKNGLTALNNSDELDTIFVWFACALLELQGSLVNVHSQINGDKFSESLQYNFSYDDMGFVSHGSGQFGPKHIKLIKLVEKVSNPENLIHVEDSQKLSQDLRPILENCLKIQQH